MIDDTFLRMAATGRVARGFAHDLANILSSAGGFAQFILEDADADDESAAFARRIVKVSRKGLDLVEHLIVFARPGPDDVEDFDIYPLAEAVHAFIRKAVNANARVSFRCPEDRILVRTRRGALLDLLVVVALEAVDRWLDEPVHLEFSVSHPVSDDILASAGEATFRYGPTTIEGPAISFSFGVNPLSEQAEPPVSFDQSIEVLAKRYASWAPEAMVFGEADGGTIMSLVLPVIRRGGPKGDTEDVASRKQRVIVLGADGDQVDALTIGLERNDYVAVGSTAPLEALDLFKECPDDWDAVIVDAAMPEINGWVLIQMIKEINQRVRTVLCVDNRLGRSSSRESAPRPDATVFYPIRFENVIAAIAGT